MMESILTSVKKSIGITEECTQFDPDIIMAINSTMLALNQIGVGPEEGFKIEDKETTWSDLLNDNRLLEAVKSWVCLKVRLLFDPPTSSILKEAIKENIAELEWRFGLVADPVPEEET